MTFDNILHYPKKSWGCLYLWIILLKSHSIKAFGVLHREQTFDRISQVAVAFSSAGGALWTIPRKQCRLPLAMLAYEKHVVKLVDRNLNEFDDISRAGKSGKWWWWWWWRQWWRTCFVLVRNWPGGQPWFPKWFSKLKLYCNWQGLLCSTIISSRCWLSHPVEISHCNLDMSRVVDFQLSLQSGRFRSPRC